MRRAVDLPLSIDDEFYLHFRWRFSFLFFSFVTGHGFCHIDGFITGQRGVIRWHPPGQFYAGLIIG
jgi:hypothetical protein